MIEAIEERYPDIDQNELNNNVSGLFIAFLGIGEATGPILGSIFEDKYDFRTAIDIMAVIVLTFLVLYFSFCGNLSIFKLKD